MTNAMDIFSLGINLMVRDPIIVHLQVFGLKPRHIKKVKESLSFNLSTFFKFTEMKYKIIDIKIND